MIRRAASVALLVAVDLTAVILGIWSALAVKLVLSGEAVDAAAIWAAEQRALPLAALTTVLIFAKNGLYRPREQRGGSARILSSVALAAIVVAAVVLIGGWRFDSFYIFYASWFFVSIAAVALRASYDSVTASALDAMDFHRRVLLVGPSRLTGQIGEGLERSQSRGGVPYRVAGAHEMPPDPAGGSEEARALREAIDPARVDEVILTGATGDGDVVISLLEYCRKRGIPVRLAPTTAELLTHSLHAVPAPGLPLFDLRPPVFAAWAFAVKRAFDLVMASLIGLVVAPVMAVAALAIKLTDGGPVLHRSRRVGLNEREFTCLKLRTMQIGAEDLQDELEHENEADGALFKIRRDPRITPVGRVLRRFSIDEFPQLLNVLRGEMSLVGPRPLPLRDYGRLSDLHKKRYLVLPGMTGLWQVSGRSGLTFDDLVRLDFFYIESWSIWMDLTIIVRTIPTILFSRGAW